MRDYLYVWHDAESRFVVFAGFEFRDFLPYLRQRGGVLLLEDRSGVAEVDPASRFPFVPQRLLGELAAEDPSDGGNLRWCDYGPSELPVLRDGEIAELLFHAHMGRPIADVVVGGLRNTLLASMHDDGWYARVHYSDWSAIEAVMDGVSGEPAAAGLDIDALKRGAGAFWLRDGEVRVEERTHDVDAVYRRRAGGSPFRGGR